MPLQRLKFAPTMVADTTAYAADGAWRIGDRVRFRNGFPQSIGGWQPLNTSVFLGVCRALWAWTTLAGEQLLGVGTNLKYYIERGSTYYDITPIRLTRVLTDPFTTVGSTLAAPLSDVATEVTLLDAAQFPAAGSARVGMEEITWAAKTGDTLVGVVRGVNGTVAVAHMAGAFVGTNVLITTDMSHGAVTGDFVIFSGADAVNTVLAGEINREHQIVVRDLSTYWVIVTSYATAVVIGGGTTTAEYQVTTGLESFVQGVGWGAGGWGVSGWGVAADVGIGAQLRLWNNQNFGEDLVFGQRGGALFYWDASGGFLTRGSYISDLPGASDVPAQHNNFIVTESRFLVVLGATPLGGTELDPMLIRWSDQELIQVFTPTPTNLAGDLRLAIGSEIISAVATRQEILVWTDSALYSLQFVPELGFTQNLIADNISIAGPNAAITANNVVFWMGRDKFYTYTGASSTLPSTVDEYVFDDFNADQSFQVYAGVNEAFDEVWWFYVSASSDVNDRYVAFNYAETGWIVGNLDRTAWLDSGIRAQPVATMNGVLYAHETGVDDASVTPAISLNSYIESSDFGIGEGEDYSFVWRVLPDITFTGSTAMQPRVNMTLQPRVASGASYRAEGSTPAVTRSATVPVEQYTEQVFVRLRGRQMKFKVSCNTAGSAWRLGFPRIDIKPNGRRA